MIEIVECLPVSTELAAPIEFAVSPELELRNLIIQACFGANGLYTKAIALLKGEVISESIGNGPAYDLLDEDMLPQGPYSDHLNVWQAKTAFDEAKKKSGADANGLAKLELDLLNRVIIQALFCVEENERENFLDDQLQGSNLTIREVLEGKPAQGNQEGFLGTRITALTDLGSTLLFKTLGFSPVDQTKLMALICQAEKITRIVVGGRRGIGTKIVKAEDISKVAANLWRNHSARKSLLPFIPLDMIFLWPSLLKAVVITSLSATRSALKSERAKIHGHSREEIQRMLNRGEIYFARRPGEKITYLVVLQEHSKLFSIASLKGSAEEVPVDVNALLKLLSGSSTDATDTAEAESLEEWLRWLDKANKGRAITLYFQEMGQIPLLEAGEEVMLAKAIEAGLVAQEKLDQDGLGSEMRAEAEEAASLGLRARGHLIKANTRLVISVAKKYYRGGIPFLDLIQEGNIGLMKAADRFNYRLGNKFSTYATWWIRQSITRAIADQGRTIRVPVHMGDQINKLLQTSHRLTQELGCRPTPEELAEALELPPRKVKNMLKVARRPLSLEMPTSDDGDGEFGAFIEDGTAVAPDEAVTASMLKELLQEILQYLPPREVLILQLRFGLIDGETYTLEEVGKKLGVTRERIRQIEAQALSRLRHPAHSRRLRDYLGK